MKKRLYKSNTNRVISGVCGGIAEYFNIDPTIVRIAWVLLGFFSAAFPGIILYVVCAVVMPSSVNTPPPQDYTDYTDHNRHN
ncbi:MAG: PspC domain-containing protein [Firmicutes bacterium]|nr:PspC domain-containing protein [Bacillota bacterium]